MTKQECAKVKIWLSAQAGLLENCIVRAIEVWERSHADFAARTFQLRRCHEEALQLSKGGTIAYDLPPIGPVYASWYLGRRVNQALGILLSQADQIRPQEQIELVDLGCGTLAIQIAVFLLVRGASKCGVRMPNWHVRNLDASAPMLDFGANYLWKELTKEFGAPNGLTYEFDLTAWQQVQAAADGKRWVAASYLFDKDQDKNELLTELNRVASELEPDQLLVWTTDQKRDLLIGAKPEGYLDVSDQVRAELDQPLKGNMIRLRDMRRHLGLDNSPPRWRDNHLFLRAFRRRQRALVSKSSSAMFAMYTVPARRIRLTKLTREQEAATLSFKAPTQISGPAGCGKTIVLIRKLEQIMRYGKGSLRPPRVLFTTFNKHLVLHIKSQIEELLETNAVREGKDGSPSYLFDCGEGRRILLMHFDLLPTHLGDVHKSEPPFCPDESTTINRLGEISNKRLGNEDSRLKRLANGGFLAEEYHRVVFGRNCSSLNEYRQVERPRSTQWPITLQREGVERAFVWEIIEEFESKYSNFTWRRRRFLRWLQEGSLSPEEKFTHVLVDEAQDCTPSDFAIFFALLSNPSHLTAAADLAQSVYLGKSASLPTSVKITKGKAPWKNHRLTATFRIPYWTARALLPLSRWIVSDNSEIDLLAPHKGAVPGTRPLLIYASDVDQLAAVILKCQQIYAGMWKRLNEPPSTPLIQVLEPDTELVMRLNAENHKPAVGGSIFKLKGLERRFVVWSLNAPLPGAEKEEAAYTIATRTSSILVIACAGQPHADYKEIHRWLDWNLVAPWDEKSAQWMEDLKNKSVVC